VLVKFLNNLLKPYKLVFSNLFYINDHKNNYGHWNKNATDNISSTGYWGRDIPQEVKSHQASDEQS